MTRLLSIFLLLATAWLPAKTLTSIVLLPPATGYVIPLTSSTVQLAAQCRYDDLSVDSCSGFALTWGAASPTLMTVNSSGLVSMAIPGVLGANATACSITSNVMTVTASNAFVAGEQLYVSGFTGACAIANNLGFPLIVLGSTGSAFTVGFTHANFGTTSDNGTWRRPSSLADTYAYNINTGTITNCAIASGTATLTVTSMSHPFVPGQNVNISASSHCPNLVNTPLTIATASATQFTVLTKAANVTSGSDTGTAQTSVLGHISNTVEAQPATSVTFTSVAIPEVVQGSTVVMAIHDNNNVNVTALCNWSSSSPSIGTINNVGEFTGVATGTTSVTCAYASVTANVTITVTNPTTSNTTWYVRPNGGTRYDAAVTSGQCSGLVDADYSGSGTNQPCAFNNPMYCHTDETSSSVYTGAVQPGDTCFIHPAPANAPYHIYNKNSSTVWISDSGGYIRPPSGPTGHPTRYVGSNWASCSNDPYHAGNRANMITMGGNFSAAFTFEYRQNIDTSCLDISTGNDCNEGINGGNAPEFPCPVVAGSPPKAPFIVVVNDMTSNFTDENSRWHGAFDGLTGTPGPGTLFTGTSAQYNAETGLSFDDPFGRAGVEADGFTFTGGNASFNGCTEEQPKSLASVSRDGAGNLSVTFAASQVVNYINTNNLVLSGMTPSDLNGTFPVTSITFNQQTQTITGGSIATIPSHSGTNWQATYNTSSAVAWAAGAYVHITGVTPSNANGNYEVYSVSGSSFTIIVNDATNPTWVGSGATISAGGSASTAISLVAAAAGGAESASTLGAAGHVYSQHRCEDQGDGAGGGNGDAVGTGSFTIGSWNAYSVTLQDNTQDGWDMLHSAMTTSVVDKMFSSGNMGAPLKFGNLDTGSVQSSQIIGNAAKMTIFDPNKPPDFNQYLSFFYRAGDTMVIAPHSWSHFALTNNTFWTSFGNVFDSICFDADCTTLPAPLSYYYLQNLIIGGYKDTNPNNPSAALPQIFCGQSCNGVSGVDPAWQWLNDIGFNTKTAGAPPVTFTDPLVVGPINDITTVPGESAALSWDMNLTAPSPAIGFGINNMLVPATDFNGVAETNPPVTGAFVFGGTPTASTPTFSPVAGSYGPTQTVTISTTSSGAIICYNTTGSPATNGTTGCSAGTLYTSPVSVSTSQTLYAVAGGTGWVDSTVGSAAYVINGAVANPTCTPAAGTYSSTQSVTCSSSTGGSTTTCTTNGSTPTHGSPTCTAISVASSLTLKALSFETGWSDSSVVSNAYTITSTVATPTFSPIAGTYSGTQSITISTITGGASIIYTNDGSTPTVSSGCTITNGTLYSGPVTVASSLTLKAIGCETSFTPSTVATAAYVILTPTVPIKVIGNINMQSISVIP